MVDVRNNNGGFVNAYALDVLARRGYLYFQNRNGSGQPIAARSQLGQRALEAPTILPTNQHSLSDAEDFTEGYRSLKLGTVVGKPTAGWIVYTSNVPLIDGTTIQLPGTLVTTSTGEKMEMSPRPVDIRIDRPLGGELFRQGPPARRVGRGATEADQLAAFRKQGPIDRNGQTAVVSPLITWVPML